ncbi:MAG: hypothetical protein IPN72_19460 [Saprospiraceae bacterium]|nr:hypothetical protein [Saprospiraceae bacterium]
MVRRTSETILPSIFEIFCRFADRQDETFNNYIENIIKTLNSDNDTDYSRVIGYYLFDKNDSNLLINVNKFITLLIDNAYYKNNEIYWLITNYLYWKSASNTYKNMNIWKFSNVDLEKFTTKIESLIINNLKILFNIDVVSFLNNVIMPIENNPRIFSYTILFKIVPIHISTSEVLNSLNALDKNNNIIELLNFIERIENPGANDKISSKTGEILINYDWSFNNKIKDKS